MNYLLSYRKSGVVVELPEVECEDGSTICPLTITWLESSGTLHHLKF